MVTADETCLIKIVFTRSIGHFPGRRTAGKEPREVTLSPTPIVDLVPRVHAARSFKSHQATYRSFEDILWGRPLCLLSRGGAYKNICQRFRPDQTRASRAHATVIAFYGALLKIGNRSRSCLASLMAETTAGRFLLRGQTLGTGSARVPRSIAWIVAGLDGGGRHAPHHTCLRLWGMDGWRRGWEEEGWAEKRTILFFLQYRRHLNDFNTATVCRIL